MYYRNQFDILLTTVADVSKGQRECHTKVTLKHSVNKVWDIKFVLRPVDICEGDVVLDSDQWILLGGGWFLKTKYRGECLLKKYLLREVLNK